MNICLHLLFWWNFILARKFTFVVSTNALILGVDIDVVYNMLVHDFFSFKLTQVLAVVSDTIFRAHRKACSSSIGMELWFDLSLVYIILNVFLLKRVLRRWSNLAHWVLWGCTYSKTTLMDILRKVFVIDWVCKVSHYYCFSVCSCVVCISLLDNRWLIFAAIKLWLKCLSFRTD